MGKIEAENTSICLMPMVPPARWNKTATPRVNRDFPISQDLCRIGHPNESHVLILRLLNIDKFGGMNRIEATCLACRPSQNAEETPGLGNRCFGRTRYCADFFAKDIVN